MKTKKSTAFWSTFAFLAVISVIMAWRSPDQLVAALGTILPILVANAAVYCGANVIDNWTRSKHYQKDLDKGN